MDLSHSSSRENPVSVSTWRLAKMMRPSVVRDHQAFGSCLQQGSRLHETGQTKGRGSS